MGNVHLFAPSSLMLAMLVALIVFWIRTARGAAATHPVKHNEVFGPFLARYVAWLLRPIERAFDGRVTPNTVTAFSLLCFVVGGIVTAVGHLGSAVMLFAIGGVLDILDGRLARLRGEQSKAGALFDSVADRWADLAMFTGFAWLLRDTAWLLAVIGAMSGSLMVSYTRARAEGLGIDLSGGMMQRAERVVLVCAGAFIAGWSGGSFVILGVVMSLCAFFTLVTAIGRFVRAYRALERLDAIRRWIETGDAPSDVAEQPGGVYLAGALTSPRRDCGSRATGSP